VNKLLLKMHKIFHGGKDSSNVLLAALIFCSSLVAFLRWALAFVRSVLEFWAFSWHRNTNLAERAADAQALCTFRRKTSWITASITLDKNFYSSRTSSSSLSQLGYIKTASNYALEVAYSAYSVCAANASPHSKAAHNFQHIAHFYCISLTLSRNFFSP
jgi:hypothetical protein